MQIFLLLRLTQLISIFFFFLQDHNYGAPPPPTPPQSPPPVTVAAAPVFFAGTNGILDVEKPVPVPSLILPPAIPTPAPEPVDHKDEGETRCIW